MSRIISAAHASVRAKLGGKLQQRLIVAARCGQLHAALRARDSNCGDSREAEGSRVAQQSGARLRVIGAGRETRYGRARQQDQRVV